MTAFFPAPQSAAALLDIARARALSHVALGCVDWDGRLRAKHYAVRALESALAHGLAMTTAIFAQDVREQPILFGPFADPAGGYADGRLVLEPASARAAPHDHGGAGILALGAFAPPYAGVCPRAIAADELERYAGRGITVRGGFELEFRLLDERATTLAQKSAQEMSPSPGFDRMYSVVEQAASARFLHDYAELAETMRTPIAALHHEYEGLVEAALAPAHGIEIADGAVLARTLAAIVAQRDGRLACFMARASERMQSAGAHLNLSLCDREGACLFALDDGVPNATLRAFLGGLQRHLPALFVLCAPNINSYKRFAPDCLAPRANTWGIDNKTVACRVVSSPAGAVRIEIRVPGADANPHLVLAALLAAGRAGLERSLEPTAPCVGDADAPTAPRGTPFPRSLEAAVACWRGSEWIAATFDAAFVDGFARSREWELARFAAAVTDWELRSYARVY